MLAIVASIFFVGGGFVMAQSPTPGSELAEAKKLLKDHPPDALTILKRILQKNEKDAQVWYVTGVAYSELNDFKKAQSAFERATTIDPQFSEAHTALAYAYLRRAKLKEGMIAVNKALSIQPNSAAAHYTLGVILFRTGDRTEALTHAEAAIKSNPNFAEAYSLESQASITSTCRSWFRSLSRVSS
jgi:tetratricopeptide (TPR) repeat protein